MRLNASCAIASCLSFPVVCHLQGTRLVGAMMEETPWLDRTFPPNVRQVLALKSSYNPDKIHGSPCSPFNTNSTYLSPQMGDLVQARPCKPFMRTMLSNTVIFLNDSDDSDWEEAHLPGIMLLPFLSWRRSLRNMTSRHTNSLVNA